MKNNEIVLRDPFVLVENGKYYLYGTRSLTCWGEADGFDAYVGTDLELLGTGGTQIQRCLLYVCDL